MPQTHGQTRWSCQGALFSSHRWCFICDRMYVLSPLNLFQRLSIIWQYLRPLDRWWRIQCMLNRKYKFPTTTYTWGTLHTWFYRYFRRLLQAQPNQGPSIRWMVFQYKSIYPSWNLPYPDSKSSIGLLYYIIIVFVMSIVILIQYTQGGSQCVRNREGCIK